MLSIWKLRVGVENYYLAQVAHGLEDYYSGRGEMPGRWLGSAASGLGLGPEPVAADALRAVLAGLQPGTGESPNGGPPRLWPGRVPGFDLTFAAPKSVSVLYALGDPLVVSDVVRAVDKAVDDAVAWLERETCFVRRGSNNRAAAQGATAEFGTRRLRGAGFVAAGFRHRTSRAGDPHLHTHVLVANTTRGPDGRWSALDAQGLYRSKMTAGAVFRASLQEELTVRLGVSWRRTSHGLAEIAGIPQPVLELFSKRRSEIEAELAALGTEGPVAAAEAMLSTRRTKADVDLNTLRQQWTDEAATIGFSGDSVDALLSAGSLDPDASLTIDFPDEQGQLIERDVRSAEFASLIAERMIEVDSTCTRHQITALVADQLHGRASVSVLEEVTSWLLAQPQLVPVPSEVPAPAGWEQRWTSQHLLQLEAEVLGVLADRTETARLSGDVIETVIGRVGTLGSDQAAAVRRVCGQGGAVGVIVGRAGTGKTFTMAAVRQAYEAAGYQLVGAAPSARAARELADGAGIDSFTVPRFMRHAAPALSPNHVVVVDEAGMTGTVDAHRLLTAACRAGAKVILVGDHHQLPEINAGGVFRAAVEHLGPQVAELTVNRRQRDAWEHQALDQLRHGHPLDGFRTYQEHGHVHLTATPTEAHTAAVDRWATAHRAGVDAILLAGTRNEARALNRLARTQIRTELTGPIHDIGGRSFQIGDRVVLLRNSADGHWDLDRRLPARVDNGMLATITAINDHAGLEIRLTNGRHLRLDAEYVRAGLVDHGYATTVHKAQGLTCDQVMVVGPTGLYREAVYVAMSRARAGSWIYATSAQVAELAERSHATGIPLPSEHDDEIDHDLHTAIEQSRSKDLAHTHGQHLQAAGRLAEHTTLDVLLAQQQLLRTTIRRIVADGFDNPDATRIRLALAVEHRRFLAPGVRVNAADWDNLGTVTTTDDTTGTARVQFVSSDGQRRSTHRFHWADIRPVDHPEPVELTTQAAEYLDDQRQLLDETMARWSEQLNRYGISPDDLQIVPAAITIRRQRLADQLAGTPPAWLTWWNRHRPTDPAGAQVWDHEISELAYWRDIHHLDPGVPGYGPAPTDPGALAGWREHLDRSLDTRTWLEQHSPTLPRPVRQPVNIAVVRERLEELAEILATAPPDQTRIIDALHTGDLTPADIHQALAAAAHTQTERQQWILDHWHHVVEHAELTQISNSHDPLAHWPAPPSAAQLALLHQLQALSTDTPEPTTLTELDARIADQDPHRQLDQLRREAQRVHTQLDNVTTALDGADDIQRTILDGHRARLLERRADLDHQIRVHHNLASLWTLGSRPNELTAATVRRSNHLAHDAITSEQPWVTEAIRDWHHTHPTTSVAELHRLITDIAAWRERTTCTSPHPLGDPQTIHDAQHAATRANLDRRLQHAPTQQISSLLTTR